MVEAQRFNQKYYTPINSTFNMAINGLITLRSYRKFEFFKENFDDAVELSSNACFCFISVHRWIGIRIDLFAGLFAILTCTLAVFMANSGFDRGLLTMSLQIIQDAIVYFSISIRMLAEIPNMMTSSQRIYEYTQLELEDDLEKPDDKSI
jgi:hypothetical protein